jgi:transposase
MARRIHLRPHLSVAALERRYRTAKEPNERTWWQLLWLLAQGRTATELSAVTGYRAAWIGQIAKRYNAEGPAGMVNRRHIWTRRTPSLLSTTQLEELRQALSGPAPEGERWSSRTVAAWMSARLGRPIAPQRGWDYLQRLDARLRQPRPRHITASAEEQAAFKKRFVG